MKRAVIRGLAIVFPALTAVWCAGALVEPPAASLPQATATNAAVTPTPRAADGRWMALHASFNARARQGAEKGDVGIIFLGDSITHGWSGAGKAVWDEFYTRRDAVNFGIGGDRTQHVLWRIQNGNLDGLATPKNGHAPRLVVLLIGTNNSNGEDHTAEEIADGISACIAAIGEKLPEAKVLLLSIFPRGERPGAQRDKNAEASRLAAAGAVGKRVHHLDLTTALLEPDGTLSKAVMPDLLHLSEAGYRRWAEAMEPKVRELLGEPEQPSPKAD